MSETTTTPGTTPGDNSQNNGSGTSGGTDPNKTGTGADAGQGTIDTSKWTDADWQKVYDDPKLYNHPRFKTLNERASKAKELEEAQAKAKEEELKKNQEWQKLAETKEQEANSWKERANNAFIDNQIAIEAQKAGVVDLEAVTKLISRSGIKLGEDGTVTGVAEAVKALVEAKPYLKGKAGNNTTIGGGSAPAGDQDQSTPRFTKSQIEDPKFFREHEKDIMKAMAIPGGIVDDKAK